jgi:uncharacterized protein (DUF2147 family)
MRKAIYFLFMSFMMATIFSQTETSTTNPADRIVGVWQVGSGKARVKITKYGDKYAGKIVWLKEPNNPDGTKKVDKNNPDEAKRTVQILGLTNLIGFEFKSGSEYENGTIYDPENGSTYNCVITLEDDNTLKVRGYIGVTIFGRTDSWKRLVVKTN